MNGNQHVRFEGLDVLRGLAAMYVVLSHYTSFCLRTFGEVPFHVQAETGNYAVWLFFMISGFVIFFTIERSTTWTDFAVSRITKLYPVYWATLTIVVAIETLLSRDHHFWLGGYVTNMTMFQEYLGYENNDVVYWSLTVELAFYFSIAILFRAGMLKKIGTVSLIWLAMSWAGALLERYFDQPMSIILTQYLIIQYVPFFLLGIMLYLNRMRGLSAPRAIVIIAALATIWLIHGPLAFVVSLSLFSIAALAVSGRGRFLATPVLLWLGAISYPLYLIHRNLGYKAMEELHKHGWPTWAVLLVTMAVALVLATMLTYFIERPACAYLRTVYRNLKNRQGQE